MLGLSSKMKVLEEKGLKDVRQRVFVSNRVHICFDLHGIADTIAEDHGRHKLGITRKGIGPSHSDKVGRHGAPVWMLVSGSDHWEQQLRNLAAKYRKLYGDEALRAYDIEEEITYLKTAGTQLKQYVVDQSLLLSQSFGVQGLATVKWSSKGPMPFSWMLTTVPTRM
jgi:adenylosuccinate synthase